MGDKVRKIALVCFDKEDCQEGLYHDELATALEEDAKKGALDEVLELNFKGAQIARKISSFSRYNKTFRIESGKEIFVALPEIQE